MFDDLYKQILAILPDATMGEDNDGQLIIYTNLRMVSQDGQLAELEDEA